MSPPDAIDRSRACTALTTALAEHGLPALVEAVESLALLHVDEARLSRALDAPARALVVELARAAGFTHVALVLDEGPLPR